jgi:hypothetical protein
VTSPLRIALLAYRTAQRLARLLDREPVAGLRQLRAALTVDGGYFGGGYGRATATGRRAIDAFRRAGGPPLDVVYSGKSGASLLARARRGEGPLLFWATKSSAPLAEPTAADVARAPAALRAWLRVPGSPSAV